jgi:CheY-like chemotaxis protein/MinD-like ATPase involved in chromosome partitioning or flagellar assembly
MAEKILIVDDDLDTLRLVGLMLQRQGYEIVAANSGEQAVTMAQGENPELILLDVMMPDMDGVEVTRRLRAEPSTRDIPIIMFTAKTQVEDKILGFEAGADDYLTKPTQPRELFAHVKAVLARTSKTKAPPTQLGEKGSMVGIIAARGGLGVSTLALNLGVTLYTGTKKDVLVAEFRPGLGTISQELGYLRPEGLTHLLQQKANEISVNSIESELITHTSGVRFLLASPQPSDAKLNSVVENFTAIARNLPYLARYVVLDLGTALSPVNIKVTPLCDEVIVVVEPVPQTLQQTKLLITDLAAIGVGAGRISIVLVNRIRSGMQLSWSQVQEQLGENIDVIFTPAPELAYQATMKNLPMVLQQPESLTVQQFTKLSEKVAQLR